jgi:hypothetical protein
MFPMPITLANGLDDKQPHQELHHRGKRRGCDAMAD